MSALLGSGRAIGLLGVTTPSRFELELDEDIGKRESTGCIVRFGLSDSAPGRYDASPTEFEVDEDIGKR